jgi:cytochrome c
MAPAAGCIPFAPGSLSADDTYAVTAYMQNLNGLLLDDAKLDQKTLPKIIMPNREGFVPDPEFSKTLPRRQ